MARIGIDLDGVAYDCQESIWRYALTELGPDTPRPNGEWDIHELFGQTDIEFLEMCHRGVDAGVIFGPGPRLTYPGVREALQRLKAAGHEVVIITARTFWGSDGMAQRNTDRWLAAERLPHDEVIYAIDKTVVPTDYFVEDKAGNYDSLVLAGCEAYLVDRPWNHEAEPSTPRRRVDGLRHFAEVVVRRDREGAAVVVPEPRRLIGLSGYARSGKDTVAEMLWPFGYVRRSFATPLKDAVYALDPLVGQDMTERVAALVDEYGWDEVKVGVPEARRLLQRMGTEVGRVLFGEDFWVERAFASLRPGAAYVFADCRFPNEAKAIRAAGGQVWRVERPGVGPITDHPSETSLDDWDFDLVLDNSGDFRFLAEQVHEAVKAL